MDLSFFGFPTAKKEDLGDGIDVQWDTLGSSLEKQPSPEVVSTNPNLKHGKSYDSVFPVEIWNDSEDNQLAKKQITPSKNLYDAQQSSDQNETSAEVSDYNLSVEVTSITPTTQSNNTKQFSNDIDLIHFDDNSAKLNNENSNNNDLLSGTGNLSSSSASSKSIDLLSLPNDLSYSILGINSHEPKQEKSVSNDLSLLDNSQSLFDGVSNSSCQQNPVQESKSLTDVIDLSHQLKVDPSRLSVKEIERLLVCSVYSIRIIYHFNKLYYEGRKSIFGVCKFHSTSRYIQFLIK